MTNDFCTKPSVTGVRFLHLGHFLVPMLCRRQPSSTSDVPLSTTLLPKNCMTNCNIAAIHQLLLNSYHHEEATLELKRHNLDLQSVISSNLRLRRVLSLCVIARMRIYTRCHIRTRASRIPATLAKTRGQKNSLLATCISYT